MHILLIEPDKLFGQTTKQSLEKFGHTIVWRRSAQTALDALDGKVSPEVIVVELQLGLHNGIEFIYEIRSYPEWQNLPVVIYSINQHILDDQYKAAFKQLGVKNILYKPDSNIHQLRRVVENLASIPI